MSWKLCVVYTDNIGWCKDFRSVHEMLNVLRNVLLHSGIVRKLTVEVVSGGRHEGEDC